MICPHCHQPTGRIIITADLTACAMCLGLSESGGPAQDGILTRTSQRVREQQREHEGDMILPHRYDQASKRVIPNEAFVEGYSDRLDNFFSQAELEQAGYTKIGKVFEHTKLEKAKAEASKDVTFKPGTPEV